MLNFYLIFLISSAFFTFFFKNFFSALKLLIICSIRIWPKHSWNYGEKIREWTSLSKLGWCSTRSCPNILTHSSAFPPVLSTLTTYSRSDSTDVSLQSSTDIFNKYAAILAIVLEPLLKLLTRIVWLALFLILQNNLWIIVQWNCEIKYVWFFYFKVYCIQFVVSSIFYFLSACWFSWRKYVKLLIVSLN